MAAFAIPILASVAGSLISKMMAPKQDAGGAPAPGELPKAPQAAQMPSAGAFSATNAAAAATSGPSSTELSGVGGVDPSLLKLGKNTLLGS